MKCGVKNIDETLQSDMVQLLSKLSNFHRIKL